MRRLLLFGGAGLLVLAILAWLGARQFTPRLHDAVVSVVAGALESSVELGAARITFFPLQFRAESLVARHHGRRDVPPLLLVKSFVVDLSVAALWRRTIDHVAVEGVEINLPPRVGSGPRVPFDRGPSGSSRPSGVVIRRITATNSRLMLIPRESGKNPKVWDIYSLVLHDLGGGMLASFEASITNPIPFGTIEATGHFGPWQADDPSGTPVDGGYTFAADLGTIKGLEGHVDAKGTMKGVLEKIATSGDTSTEHFRLTRLHGSALPLTTRYEAVVDGTNGDVALTSVEIVLGLSTLHAHGAIEGTKGIKGKRVVLAVTSEKADLENLLRFLANPAKPPARGSVGLDAAFDLRQGDEDVLDRLTLSGTVHAEQLHFTDAGAQDQIDNLSRRGQGRPSDLSIDEMASRVRGAFALTKGILNLKELAFDVKGAAIRLAGRYALEPGTLDLSGEVRLIATASNTQTGYKSWLLKPFDPIFREGKTGTLLAIKIGGTADKPNVVLEIRRTLKGK